MQKNRKKNLFFGAIFVSFLMLLIPMTNVVNAEYSTMGEKKITSISDKKTIDINEIQKLIDTLKDKLSNILNQDHNEPSSPIGDVILRILAVLAAIILMPILAVIQAILTPFVILIQGIVLFVQIVVEILKWIFTPVTP